MSLLLWADAKNWIPSQKSGSLSLYQPCGSCLLITVISTPKYLLFSAQGAQFYLIPTLLLTQPNYLLLSPFTPLCAYCSKVFANIFFALILRDRYISELKRISLIIIFGLYFISLRNNLFWLHESTYVFAYEINGPWVVSRKMWFFFVKWIQFFIAQFFGGRGQEALYPCNWRMCQGRLFRFDLIIILDPCEQS